VAQSKTAAGPFSLITEGWVNATGGQVAPDAEAREGQRGHWFADTAIRLLGVLTVAPKHAVGARVVIAANGDDGLVFEQGTGMIQGRFGRFEVGRRQGLPDVLIAAALAAAIATAAHAQTHPEKPTYAFEK